VVRMKEPKGQHSAGFRPELGAGKRMSRMGRLAEGEELWSNILFAGLRSDGDGLTCSRGGPR
jgi:hypothetical protein